MINSAERRKRKIVDYDYDCIDDKKPMFGWINGATRCGIYLHVAPTNKRRNKRDGIETQYLLQGKCKVFCKEMTCVCSNCMDIDEVKNEMWFYHPKTNHSCFAQHVHSTHEL